MTTTTTATTPKVRATAWDPSCPSTLALPEGESMHTLRALSGAGSCNDYERAALFQLLQAHETSGANSNIKTKFDLYRQAVSDCLADWAESGIDREHMDYLGMNYAALHLCSILVPLLAQSSWTSDPFAIPGLAMADLVRYLRHNHTSDLDLTVEAGAPFPWPTVTQLVLRGCLEDAWEVLAQHPVYLATLKLDPETQSLDPQYVHSMHELRVGFERFRELLLRAPLPAGRTDVYDNDLEPSSSLSSATTTTHDETAYLLDDLPVAATDYQFWESNSSSATTTADVPIEFNPEAAKAKHRIWQDYIAEIFDAPLLTRQVPEIAGLLRILRGDLRESNSAAQQNDWATALLAEVLYRQPDLRPRQWSTRARKIVQDQQQQQQQDDHVIQALLTILDGNVGQALELLHHYGGGTGAALPATLLALLFSLLVDSGVLHEEVAERKFHFVCEAATAIQSSLANTDHHDTGAQLAIRLLLPYQEEAQIRTFLAEVILDHYTPTTESYMKAVLFLVRPLIERKSLQILDATANVVISLHQRLVREQEYEAAVLVLLEGLKLEALVIPQVELGSCYRTLSKLGLETITNVLEWSLTPDKTQFVALALAQGMKAVVEQHAELQKIPEAMLVVHGVPLANALVLQQYDRASEAIVRFLQEDVDPATGTTIFRPALHRHVLCAAKKTMEALENDPANGFDTQGMSILMERHLQLTALQEELSSSSDKKEMETALAKGLAHAFVVENTRKAATQEQKKQKTPYDDDLFDGMTTSNLHMYSLDVQERYVQHLLDG